MITLYTESNNYNLNYVTYYWVPMGINKDYYCILLCIINPITKIIDNYSYQM